MTPLQIEIAQAVKVCETVLTDRYQTLNFLVMVAPAGSSYITGQRGRDIDVIAFVDQYNEGDTIPLFEMQRMDPSREYQGEMVSYRGPDDINLIICTTVEYYQKWRAATEVCKELKVTDKQQRILVHQLIMDAIF
jgi:hypothetical protein